MKWNTVIEQKAKELARYLVKKSRQVDFSEPSPELQRSDNMGLRRRILGLSQAKARKLGICKSTLHYLRENAKRDCSFKLYRKVRDKLQSEVTCGQGMTLQNQTKRKLQEAEYFLSMMNNSFEDDDLFANNFSAFLSAARSITFYMQNQYDDCQGFSEWYSQQQAEMRADPEFDFLNMARIENVHKEYVSTGATREIGFGVDMILVSEGSPEHRQAKAEQRDDSMQNGPRTIRRFFLLDSGKVEVIVFCQKQLAKLSRMVEECESRFQQPEVDKRA